MKKVLLATVCLVAIAVSAYQFSSTQQPAAKPVPVKTGQMWLYYQQVDPYEAAMLACASVGSGYLCPVPGAGGGGHAFEM